MLRGKQPIGWVGCHMSCDWRHKKKKMPACPKCLLTGEGKSMVTTRKVR